MSDSYRDRLHFIYELRKQKQFELALQEVEALRGDGHQGPDLDVQEADLLGRMGRPAPALALLERWPWRELPEYGQGLLAGLLEEAGRAEESEAIFEDLAGRPHLSVVVGRRVQKWLETTDPERAVHFARRQAAPTAESQRVLAQSLRKAGKLEEALQVLEEGVKLYPKDEWLVREHVMARLDGLTPEELVGELETLLTTKAYGGNAQLQERLLQAYRKTGRFEAARKLVMELLEKQPRNTYLKSNLAYVLRDLGEIDRCLDLLEEVLEEDPRGREPLSAYFSTCATHSQRARVAAYVARRTQADPSSRGLWGKYKKYFPG